MADERFTVVRAQDGYVERADLTLEQARAECAILNAQARQQTGISLDGVAIFGAMHHGEISRHEVRSSDGLVVA